MPADRSSKKASSSRSALPYSVKAEAYGASPRSARSIMFAPNVTPGTYLDSNASSGSSSQSDAATLPSSETPVAAPSKRREPPGKRRSQGYIPRPPNAFMLFRSDFVQSKHIPGSISTTHKSLSRITGDSWAGLSPDEKRKWEDKAKDEKEAHAKMYPDYKFRPVHNKEKKAAKRKAKVPMPAEEERRCEDVTQLLLEGKKGDELVVALRRLTLERQRTAANTPESFAGLDAWAPPPPVYQLAPYWAAHRRSSSAPVTSQLYNPIMLPSLPFLRPSQPPAASRPVSPVRNISRAQRNVNARRASSAQPTPRPSWTFPMDMELPVHMPVPAPLPATWQRDWSPVPEPDTSLFEPAYVADASPFSQTQKGYSFPTCDPAQRQQLSLTIDPLDCGPLGLENYSDSALSSAPSPSSALPFHMPFAHSTMVAHGSGNNGWAPTSGSTSAISASPAPSDHSYALNAGLLAQQLQLQAQVQEGWMQQAQQQQPFDLVNDFGGQIEQPQLQQYASMGHVTPAYSPVEQFAEVSMSMGEPSPSGSQQPQQWYANEAQFRGFEGQYAEGVFAGDYAEDAFGLGDAAQTHAY